MKNRCILLIIGAFLTLFLASCKDEGQQEISETRVEKETICQVAEDDKKYGSHTEIPKETDSFIENIISNDESVKIEDDKKEVIKDSDQKTELDSQHKIIEADINFGSPGEDD